MPHAQPDGYLTLPATGSGRAVLGLALTALARHYGLLGRTGAGINRWGMDGYRPAVPELEEA